MFTINVISSIAGSYAVLTSSDIENFSDLLIYFRPAGSACTFVISHGDEEITGKITLSADETSLLLAFDDDYIAVLPSGICINVDCNCAGCDENSEEVLVVACNDSEVQAITGDTRIAILDNDGCFDGYITAGSLLEFIKNNLSIPETICDLFNGGIGHSQTITSSDRVLIVSDDDCSVSSVGQDQITGCP